MIRYLTIASLLFASVFYWGSNFYGTRFLVFLLLGALWIGGITASRIHWAAGACLGWTLISAILVFGAPTSPYVGAGDFAVLAFDSSAAVSAVSVLVVALLCLNSTQRVRTYLFSGMSLLCFIDSSYVIGQWALGHDSTHRGGFFGNASLNACLIAFTYPILTRKQRRPATEFLAFLGTVGLVAAPLSVIVSRSNMALAALISAFAAPYIIRSAMRRRLDGVFTPGLILVLLGLGFHFMGPKFGNDTGRFEIWRTALQWWWAHANRFTGTGLGSYFIIGPGIQMAEHVQEGQHLLWMHNDFLQVLFEQGAIGLVLSLLLFGITLRESVRKNLPHMTAALSAFGVTMCGNFPMHIPLEAVVGAFFVVFVLTD